jgi:phospholipase/carboxylesterase
MIRKLFGFIILCAFTLNSQAQQIKPLALFCKISTPPEITSITPIVILLHGYGSNESDMFGLKSIMPENAIFVCARGSINNGDNSYKWYEIDRTKTPSKENKLEADASIAKVILLIAQLKKQYKTNGKVVLGGFSQGAILSNAILAKSPKSVQGIISLSGRLMNGIVPEETSSAIYRNIKVLQLHGTKDQVITIEKGAQVAQWLTKIGVQHQYKKLNMAHEINEEALQIIEFWLAKFYGDSA